MCLTCREMDTRHTFTFPKKPAPSQLAKDRAAGSDPEETIPRRQEGGAVKPTAGSNQSWWDGLDLCPCAGAAGVPQGPDSPRLH